MNLPQSKRALAFEVKVEIASIKEHLEILQNYKGLSEDDLRHIKLAIVRAEVKSKELYNKIR